MNGEIKAQICTGTELIAIEKNGDTITIRNEVTHALLPEQWPIGTKINLCYYGAKIEASPFNEEGDKLEDVYDIDGIEIFEPLKEDEQKGYSRGVELITCDGIWDILYSRGEVKMEIPDNL